MAGVRNGSAEILIFDGFSRLLHGRLHQSFAAAGMGMFEPRELHNAQELVADPGKGPPKQSCGIFQAPLPPNPTMPFQREPNDHDGSPPENRKQTCPSRSFD